MARVKTLMTHNNPPGVRRNPDDEYDTSEYQYLCDRRIVEMVPFSVAPAEEKSEPDPEPEVVVDETPAIANKQMAADDESKQDEPDKDDPTKEPAEGKRRKYQRRDMTAEG